jgi:hypothetical protein
MFFLRDASILGERRSGGLPPDLSSYVVRDRRRRSLSALATLALWQDDPAPAERLRAELAKRLNAENAPTQERRDDAARELRRHAETLHKPKFELSRIHHAMHQIDQVKMRLLLQEIANLLSPGTVGESIDLLWP